MLPSESHDYGCVEELGNEETHTFHTNMQIQRKRSAREMIVRQNQITALKCAHIIQDNHNQVAKQARRKKGEEEKRREGGGETQMSEFVLQIASIQHR